MYFFMLWITLPGVTLLFNSWLVLTVVPVSIIVVKRFVKEEYTYLEKSYGSAYTEYRKSVVFRFNAKCNEGGYFHAYSSRFLFLHRNNNALAAALAKAIGAEHIVVKPQKPVKMGDIVFDMMFKRTPKVQPDAFALAKYDKVVLMGPIWCGGPASPLRPYLKQLKAHPQPYAFVTLSGGGSIPTRASLRHSKKRQALIHTRW